MRSKLIKLSIVGIAAAVVGGGVAVAAVRGDETAHAVSASAPAQPGPRAMSDAYEVFRSDVNQPKVDVTSIGGLRQGTHVLTLHLEGGSYLVWAFVTAGKAFGEGVLRCAVLVPEGAVTFARVAMGDQAGTSRAATLTSNGGYTVPEGGTDLELKCTQEPGATGSTPQVFDALIDALEVRTLSSAQGS